MRQVANLTNGTRLARSGNFIYLNEERPSPTGRIRRVDTTATNPTPTVVVDGLDDPSAIAVDATHVYFASGEQLMRAPIEGATTAETLSTVVAGLTQVYEVDDKYVYASASGPNGQRIVRITK